MALLLMILKFKKRAWDKISIKLSGKPVKRGVFAQNRGLRAEDFVEFLAGKKVEASKMEVLTKEKETLTKNQYKNNSESVLFKGLVDFLNQLKNLGVPRSIVTSASEEMVRFYFKTLNLRRWFEWKQTIYNDGFHKGKPSPEPYLLGAKQLGFKPSECVVFEDAPSGVLSAHKAGVNKIVGIGSRHTLNKLKKLPEVSFVAADFTKISLDSILN